MLQMIIIIAISAIGIVCAIPDLHKSIKRHKIEDQATQLSNTIREGHLYAIQHRITATLDLSENSYVLRRGFPRDIALQYHTIPDGIQIAALPPTGVQIRFSPSGATSPKSIYLRDTSNECKVTLALRGRITEKCWEIEDDS